jgi:glycosyltransferase involved in cell wall biosynthesis
MVVVAPGFVPPFVLGRSREQLDEGEPAFLAVGRLASQKGFDLLLQAFARCADSVPGWRLRVLGSGPLLGELTQLTTSLGLEDRVEWIPRHPAPWSHATRSSVFVLSSRYEGFPNVLLEAMAVGLPPVAFDCPSGPAEIIAPGRNGILVPGGDVERLADAMQEIATTPDLRERMAEAAWADVRRDWTLERTLETWDSFFAEARAAGRVAPRA